REEQLQRILAAFLFHLLERTVDDALGNSLLAAFHDHVHEFGQLDIAELGIRQDFTFRDFATTWHVSPLASVDDRNVLLFRTPRRSIRDLHLLDPWFGSLRRAGSSKPDGTEYSRKTDQA